MLPNPRAVQKQQKHTGKNLFEIASVFFFLHFLDAITDQGTIEIGQCLIPFPLMKLPSEHTRANTHTMHVYKKNPQGW